MDKIIIEPVILNKQNGIRQYGFRFEYTLYAQRQVLYQFGMEYPYVADGIPDLDFFVAALDFIAKEPVDGRIELALYFFYMDAGQDDLIQIGDKDYRWSDVSDYLSSLFSE